MRRQPWLGFLCALIALGACGTRGRAGSTRAEPSPDPPFRLPPVHVPAGWPLAATTTSSVKAQASSTHDAGEPSSARGAELGVDVCEQLSVELAQAEGLAWVALAPSLDFQEHVLWQGFRARWEERAKALGGSIERSDQARTGDPRCERALQGLREVSEGCERGPLTCPSTPHLILRDRVLLGYRSFSPAAVAACGEADAALLRAHDTAAADAALAARAALDPRLLDLAARVGALASLAADADRACRAVEAMQDSELRARQAESLARNVASILTQYGAARTTPSGVTWSAPRMLSDGERQALALMRRTPRDEIDARAAEGPDAEGDDLWSDWVLTPQTTEHDVAERMRRESQLLRVQ